MPPEGLPPGARGATADDRLQYVVVVMDSWYSLHAGQQLGKWIGHVDKACGYDMVGFGHNMVTWFS